VKIAVLAHHAADSFAFASDDKDHPSSQIRSPDVLRGAVIKGGHPKTGLFEDLDAPDKIRRLKEVNVLHGARGAFQARRRDRRGTIFAEHDRQSAPSCGASHNGAEIMGILDTVQQDNNSISRQTALGPVFRAIQRQRVRVEHNALVNNAAGELVQFRSRTRLDRKTCCRVKQSSESPRLRLTIQPARPALADTQALEHGNASNDTFRFAHRPLGSSGTSVHL